MLNWRVLAKLSGLKPLLATLSGGVPACTKTH